MGQAEPEIPLSVGSKLELLLIAFVFAKFPYIYFWAVHSRICPASAYAYYCCVYTVYMYVYIVLATCIYNYWGEPASLSELLLVLVSLATPSLAGRVWLARLS